MYVMNKIAAMHWICCLDILMTPWGMFDLIQQRYEYYLDVETIYLNLDFHFKIFMDIWQLFNLHVLGILETSQPRVNGKLDGRFFHSLTNLSFMVCVCMNQNQSINYAFKNKSCCNEESACLVSKAIFAC